MSKEQASLESLRNIFGHVNFSALIGTEKNVSVTPMKELTRISLKEMCARKVHKGRYLLCRVITKPDWAVAIKIGCEDPGGQVQRVFLYNMPGPVEVSSEYLEAMYPIGTILAIREPYCRFEVPGKVSQIRVDSPSDVYFVRPDDPLLDGVKWASGDLFPGSPTQPTTSDEWKNLGDAYFQKGLHFPATAAYSNGLLLDPDSILLRLNRALVFTRLGFHSRALQDTSNLLARTDLSSLHRSKALYRQALAQYGLEKWEECFQTLNICAEDNPDFEEDCQKLKEKCGVRMQEAQGSYDWERIIREAHSNEAALLDISDYTGPVEVSRRDGVGGGRGMFATQDLKVGDLLMVSKALESSYDDDYKTCKVVALDVHKDSVTNTGGALLPNRVTTKLFGDPGLQQTFYDLFHGTSASRASEVPDLPPSDDFLNSGGLLDIKTIESILHYNVFSFVTSTRIANMVQFVSPGEETRNVRKNDTAFF